MFGEPGGFASRPSDSVAVTGKRNQRGRRVAQLRTDAARKLITVYGGHRDVDDDQVRADTPQQRQRVISARRDSDVMALLAQEIADGLKIVVVVIDDENSFRLHFTHLHQSIIWARQELRRHRRSAMLPTYLGKRFRAV